MVGPPAYSSSSQGNDRDRVTSRRQSAPLLALVSLHKMTTGYKSASAPKHETPGREKPTIHLDDQQDGYDQHSQYYPQ